jgi:histidine triad (HIT) family protein
MDCIFCKIASGEIPSYTIYEDDNVKMFLDVNPDSNGHSLIVPKKHTLDLTTISNDELNNIMEVAKKYVPILEDKLSADGVTLIQNNGLVQEVKHFHLHLKPYYKDSIQKKDIKEVYEILK